MARKKVPHTINLSPELDAILKSNKSERGISFSWQVEQALRDWFRGRPQPERKPEAKD